MIKIFKLIINRIVYHTRYLFFWIKGNGKNLEKIKDLYDIDLKYQISVKDKLPTLNPEFIIHNNKWGEYKLNKRRYTQNNLKPISENINKFGWEFSPVINAKGVLGYPSIMTGGGGWGNVVESQDFPVKIKDIETLKVYYDVLLVTDELKFNLAFDLWIMNGSKRVCEIMIWEDYNIAMPHGKKKGKILEYNVYSDYMDRTHDLGPGEGWEFIALMRENKSHSDVINIKQILNELTTKGLIKLEWLNYDIPGIEFGTEVYNSSGVCIVNKFDVDCKVNYL